MPRAYAAIALLACYLAGCALLLVVLLRSVFDL